MIYTEKTSRFIEEFITEKPEFAPLRQYAEESHIPVMRVQAARFLETLTAAIQPKRILEIGTAIGYSGSLMLKACRGTLTTIELDREMYDTAAETFRKLGLSSRVTQILGDVSEELCYLNGTYDLILLDGPKTVYGKLLKKLTDLLAEGGTLFADDVFFFGMVTGETEAVPKKRTILQGLTEYLKKASEDERLITAMLPISDGVAVSVKRKEEKG